MTILNETREVVGGYYREHTKKRKQLLAILALGMLAGPMAAQAQGNYDFQLIDHPGTPETQVFGINDRGDVVGDGFIGATSFPFVYASKKGTLTDVAPASGYANTTVIGINDSGVMVGGVRSLDFSTVSGFIRSKDGTFTVFSHPEAFSFTQARGINNKGLVSGIRDTVDFAFAAFIYDPKTETFTDIVPSLFTVAHGINSNGEVVGNAFFASGAEDPCGGTPNPFGFVGYGWLRAKDGAVTFFQVNDLVTAARGINDAGFITGDIDHFDTGISKGFVVKLDGLPCESPTVDDSELLQFPGFDLTIPEGIKNSGDIVGLAIGENQHGFIATPH